MQDINEFLNFVLNNYRDSASDLHDALKKLSNSLNFLYDIISKNMHGNLYDKNFKMANDNLKALEFLEKQREILENYLSMFGSDDEEVFNAIKTDIVDSAFKKIEIKKENKVEFLHYNYETVVLDTDIPYDLSCDFTNKKPAKFKLGNKVYRCSNLKDILVILCEILYEKHPRKMKSLVSDPEFQGKKWPLFSWKQRYNEDLAKYSPVGKTGLFVMTHASGKHIQKEIEKLLSKFNIPKSEITIS